MSLRKQLAGTGVALVTPFTKNDHVDFEALGKLIDFVIKSGVNYIVTLGTTGESPVVDKQEKTDIIKYTIEKVGKRVPVVVGVGGNNTKSIINDLNTLPLQDAVAILSASPYYNKPSQEGLYEHYKSLAAASPKPVILYNVPGRTGRNMTAETTIRLSHVENIAGMKEASGDMLQCMQILRDRPEDFLVVSGEDALAMSQIACGMDGVISVAANCFPKDFSEMVKLSLENNFEAARKINNRLLLGYDLLFAENNPAGVKAFLAEQGIIENYLRLPLTPVSGPLQAKAKAFLKTL